MNRIEKTVELHKGGLTCSQALLTVYGKKYGIDPGTARLLGRTLAGGVGGQGETCGYITAALIILAHANNDETEAVARSKTHPKVMDFFRRFNEKRGTTMCKELIGEDLSTEEGLKKVREENLIAKYCHCENGIGQLTAEILEEMI